MNEPDFAILLTAANRCVADRLVAAVATVGGSAMRPSFGFVLRAVAAEEPTVSRLAELLDVTKQAASRLADDMVAAGFLQRGADPTDRRRTPLQLTELGQAVRATALTESRAGWKMSCGAGSATARLTSFAQCCPTSSYATVAATSWPPCDPGPPPGQGRQPPRQ